MPLHIWMSPDRKSAIEDARQVMRKVERQSNKPIIPAADSALFRGPCYSEFECGNNVWRTDEGYPMHCASCRDRMRKENESEKKSLVEALSEKLSSPFS